MEKNQNRPVIKIPITRLEFILEIVGILGVVGILVFLYLNWARIPSPVPQHFGFSGKVDSWGSKSILIVLPVIIGALYLILTLLSKYPQHFNYAVTITEENAAAQYLNARRMLYWLKVELVYVFSYIEFRMIQSAFTPGKIDGLDIVFLPITWVAVFGTLGYFIYQSVRNR